MNKRNLVDYYPEKVDQIYPPLSVLDFVLKPYIICTESDLKTGKKYREYEEEGNQTGCFAQELIDFLSYSEVCKSINYMSKGIFCAEFSIILDRIKNELRNGINEYLLLDLRSFFVWIGRAMNAIAKLTPYCFPEVTFNDDERKTTKKSFASHKILFTDRRKYRDFKTKNSPLDHDYIDYLKKHMKWFDKVNIIRNDIIHFLESKIFPYPANKYEEIVEKLEKKYDSDNAILSEIKEYSRSLFDFLYFFDRHFFEKNKKREELKTYPNLQLALLRIDFKDTCYENLIDRQIVIPAHVKVKKTLKEFLFTHI